MKASVVRVFVGTSILLLERRKLDRNMPGYCLPGGRAEDNELASQTAIRELEEETSIKADSVRHVGNYITSVKGKECEVCVFELILQEKPSVTISNEHISFEWVEVADIEVMDKKNQLAGRTHYAIKL